MEKGGAELLGVRPAGHGDPNCLWAEEKPRNQEEQYRNLIETMNEGFVVRDAAGLISYVNERFSTLTGYSRDEIIGRPAEDFLDDEDRKTFKGQIAGRMLGKEENYELTLIGKGGRRIHVIVSPRSVFDSGGRFKGSFAAVADVTLLKSAEEELRKSEKKLRLLSSHLLRVQEEEQPASPGSSVLMPYSTWV